VFFPYSKEKPMQILNQLLQNKVLPTEAMRSVDKLAPNDVATLMAEIEIARLMKDTAFSHDDIQFFLEMATKICKDDKAMIPRHKNDFFGNKSVIWNFEGTESDFWLQYILGSNFRPVYVVDQNHHVYAHILENKIVEFNNGEVMLRFGTKSTLLNYLFQNRPTNCCRLDDLFSSDI
jgi:hypothetical protein